MQLSNQIMSDKVKMISFHRLTQKIKKKLAMKHKNSDDEVDLFPQLPGGHLPLTNPALEFVKTVCEVCLFISSNFPLSFYYLFCP